MNVIDANRELARVSLEQAKHMQNGIINLQNKIIVLGS
jgi:hypothetical protein